jgi:hypothetical protein
MFVLAQLAALLLAGFSIFICYLLFDDGDEGKGLLALLAGLAIPLVDVLVLIRVIGPGLPLPTKTSTELLFAALGPFVVLLVPINLDSTRKNWVKLIGIGTAGLLVVGLVEGLLLAGVLWPQQHPVAGLPAPAVTASSGATPIPTVTVTRTVTASSGAVPIPTVTVTRTVTAAPIVTVTAAAATAASPASSSGQSASGAVAVAIAVVGVVAALMGGLGGLMAGLGTFSKHRNRHKKTPGSTP